MSQDQYPHRIEHDTLRNGTGYVALFRETGFIARSIRCQTRSQYSHAALAYPVHGRTDSLLVIESFPFVGVRRRRIEGDALKNVDLFKVDGMNTLDWHRAFSFAEFQLGKHYDYISVLRFVTRRKSPNNDRWFCSELVHKSLAEAGFTVLDRILSRDVSPAMLALSPMLIQSNPSPTQNS